MTSSKLLLAVSIFALTSIMGAQTGQSSPASAAVPRMIRYSGALKVDRETPLGRLTGITFALYKDQEGGPPVWVETQSVAVDAQGHYAVQLGATKVQGLPTDLFSAGEARWLGVQASGQHEQPRILLLSVPYALKAADAETLGGLPASAFVLAAPATASATVGTTDPATSAATSASAPPVSGTGTANYLPLWTDNAGALGNSILFQSGSGSTAKIGINVVAPVASLEVQGTEMVHGQFTMASGGLATTSAGKKSYPLDIRASAFNSTTHAAVPQNFLWEAEPVGNNTANPGGSLNLLFASGSASPAETGLKIANSGRITFASGQAFPGTVASVGLSAPTSEFIVSGSPVQGSGTLALQWNVTPTSSNVANSIVKRDGTGSFNATAILANTLQATSNGLSIVATTSAASSDASAISGSATATTLQATYGVAGSTFGAHGAGVVGINNNASTGYGVLGEVNNASPAVAGFNFSANGPGVLGAGPWGFYTDSNVHQGPNAGGWVKAMAVIDDINNDRVVRCFNSALPGPAATAPPCGFSYRKLANPGVYAINFGFDVSNRFATVTPGSIGITSSVSTKGDGNVAISANEVYLELYDSFEDSLVDGYFYIIVY